MEDLYRIDPRSIYYSDNITSYHPPNLTVSTSSSSSYGFYNSVCNFIQFEESGYDDHTIQFSESEMFDLIKNQIASHPLYPDMLSAYIDCQKVGAPPEMASFLEEIGREFYPINGCCSEIGADPELDDFMESYCEVLHRFKEELSKPFDEATTFFSSIESQLSNLCKGTLATNSTDEAGGTTEEELSCSEVEAPESQESGGGGLPENKYLKGMLMKKYSGYLSSLRKEFLKNRKKGKLPKDARLILLDWWNNHFRWPYPTEEEKVKLSEMTRLDQKQINNWFINQRKRHWKPSEDMRYALMEGGGRPAIGGASYFDAGGGSGAAGGD